MGLEKQAAKPRGYLGKIIGSLMNIGHTGRYIKYFQDNLLPDNSVILDIGCGGGKFIKFLSETNHTYKIFGLDHSPEMIRMSQKINQKGIDEEQVKIIQGSVMEIPLEDNSLDFVSAFETVNFWPDLQKSFSEVKRVLKPGGTFLIINLYPKEGTKWWHLAKMKSDNEFEARFKAAGFSEIGTDLKFRKGWIIAKGKNNSEP